jgi:hypothetical protein
LNTITGLYLAARHRKQVSSIFNHRCDKNYCFEKHYYAITEPIYSDEEVRQIISTIDRTNTANENFRKSNDLFAIRKFLQEVPGITDGFLMRPSEICFTPLVLNAISL